jgi:glycosyltransferase involved in cell wall biosynthesis
MGRQGDEIATDITIVIPAFNESARLPATLARLVDSREVFGGRRVDVVVSDDGSTDDTARVVEDFLGEGVRLVAGPANQGKGAALLRGTEIAVTPFMVFLDADLPVSPATVESMAARLDHQPSLDLLVGSRRLPGASFDPPQPLARRAGGHLFRSAARVLGYRSTTDPQCGVKVLRRKRMAEVLGQLSSRGFAFDIELIVRARCAGLVVEEVPVAWSHVPGSSLRPVRDGVRTLSDLVRLRQSLHDGVP